MKACDANAKVPRENEKLQLVVGATNWNRRQKKIVLSQSKYFDENVLNGGMSDLEVFSVGNLTIK